MLVAAVALIAAAGIALSSFQRQLGIAEASAGSIAAIAAAQGAAETLEGSDDYGEYAAAVRVAIAKRDAIALMSPVDTDVRVELDRAVEYLSAARQAWQADEEGRWDSRTYGAVEYWRARLGDERFDAQEGELTLDAVTRACAQGARNALASAYAAAGVEASR